MFFKNFYWLFAVLLCALMILVLKVPDKLERPIEGDKQLVKNITKNSNQWDIVQAQSQIQFKAHVLEKEFTGVFSHFEGEIFFNSDDLETSKADIRIYLKSVNSGDINRDSQMLGSDWFNVADYPIAYFKTIEFQQAEEGRYIAIGNLTLAGKTMPISLPFTLDIVEGDLGRRAYVEAQFILNRLDFGLGGAQWKSADSASHSIKVNLRLVARNLKNPAN